MRLTLVLDAMPLIYSAKTSLFTLWEKLDVELITTLVVKGEVLRGVFEERSVLERLFDKHVHVQKPRRTINAKGLDPGEASALALAKEKKATLMSDDRVARAQAQVAGVAAVHTTYFLFRALEKKVIDARQAELLLEELVESGWWCSPETLIRIHNKIHEYE